MENIKEKFVTTNNAFNQFLSALDEKKTRTISFMYDILAHYKMDETSFISCALYVGLDKQTIDYEALQKDYGKDVIDMLKKLNIARFSTTGEAELEYVRNMFICTVQDIRALIILLAYNLYLAENINVLDRNEQTVFARMVRDIYAPLANRLSLTDIKNRMQDFAFRFFEPRIYRQLSEDERLNKPERQRQIELAITKIKNGLDELKINGEVYGREKHLASVYNKLKDKNLTLSQIYDLMAIRVIVSSVEECYLVLGKINGMFTLIPNRFKDYIANPKPNGYKSIHTGVMSENKRPIEIQIRTKEMHYFNEYGVAAHWIYKSKGHKKSNFDQSISELKRLMDESKDLSNKEFVETLSRDMFSSEIFAQTPNGKIIKFPKGANCIDFAYAIHSDIGNRCVGAKINGKMMPISTELSNGDICEIILGASNKGPSRDWLNIVKTASARSKINAYFKKQFVNENIQIGKSMLETALKNAGFSYNDFQNNDNLTNALKKYNVESLDELLALIGNSSVKADSVIKKVFIVNTKRETKLKNYDLPKRKNKDSILVGKQAGVLIHLAKCCMPVQNDDIIGYMSITRGVTVHRKNCVNVALLDKDRLIEVEWDGKQKDFFPVKLKVEFKQNPSLISLAQVLDKHSIKITSYENQQNNDRIVYLVILVKSTEEVEIAKNKIAQIKDVQNCDRI